MYVEHGYAKRYGVDDGELAELVGESGTVNS